MLGGLGGQARTILGLPTFMSTKKNRLLKKKAIFFISCAQLPGDHFHPDLSG
jgi:hypothetical protein